MKTSVIQELFETTLPVSFIESETTRLGVQLRQRHLRLAKLVVPLLLMGGSPEADRLSAALRDYFEWGNPHFIYSHKASLEKRSANHPIVMDNSIPVNRLAALHIADMTKMSDEAATDLWNSPGARGYSHVIRMTGNFGPEHYFAQDVFSLFTTKVVQ